MPDIILAICYQANREPTPDELGGFKDTVEDSLLVHYTNSAGLQLDYLWAGAALTKSPSPEYRASEPETDVLADKGLCSAKVLEAAVRAITALEDANQRAARLLQVATFDHPADLADVELIFKLAETTAMENTKEGAALLRALKQLEAMNDFAAN